MARLSLSGSYLSRFRYLSWTQLVKNRFPNYPFHTKQFQQSEMINHVKSRRIYGCNYPWKLFWVECSHCMIQSVSQCNCGVNVFSECQLTVEIHFINFEIHRVNVVFEAILFSPHLKKKMISIEFLMATDLQSHFPVKMLLPKDFIRCRLFHKFLLYCKLLCKNKKFQNSLFWTERTSIVPILTVVYNLTNV